MADLSQEELREALETALRNSRTNLNLDAETVEKMVDSLKKLDKEVKSNTTSYKGLFKEMLSGRKAYKDLGYELEKLDDKIEALGDAADNSTAEIQDELIKRRQHIQTIMQHNAAQRALIDGLTRFTKTAIPTVGRGLGDFTKGLQDNSSAFSLAGGLFTSAIDTANAGAQAVGGGLTTVGTTMMMNTNPRLRMLGGAASVTGMAISALGDAAATTGKFIVGFMVKEMEKTIEAFNKTSAAGALFADGMTGMRNNAHLAGLTVKQFGEVVSKNAPLFAQSGMGVAEGAKQMGRVGKIIKETGMQDSMLKLGFGFEEQAELMADTVARMRKTAGGTVTDRQVAEQTAKYAENLRLIASITGEDAKKKMDQVKEQNQILRFQQELAKRSPEQRAAIVASMATMSDMEQKNLRDRVAMNGALTREEGAMYESIVSGAREKGEAHYQLFMANQLTAENNAALNVQYGEQIKASILSQEGIAIAGYKVGGVLGDVTKSMLDAVDQANLYTQKSKESAEKSIAAQKEASDELTQNTISAAKAAQNLAVALEEKVLGQLGKFTHYVDLILRELEVQLGKLGQDLGGPKGPSLWEDIVNYASIRGAQGAAGGAVMGGVAGGVVGAGAGGVGAIPGAAAGAWGGAQGGAILGSVWGAGEGALRHWFGTPGGNDQYAGLNIKSSESTAGGMASTKLLDLAKQVQAQYPGGTFTAFNDLHHQKNAPGSDHVRGNALDFKLPFTPDEATGQRITQAFKDMGFKTVIDEYNHPSPGSTGGHIHAALKDGGITRGPSLAGEAGPEAVIPLPNGRSIPVEMDMSALVELLRDLIDVNKDNRDYLEKLFHASV